MGWRRFNENPYAFHRIWPAVFQFPESRCNVNLLNTSGTHCNTWQRLTFYMFLYVFTCLLYVFIYFYMFFVRSFKVLYSFKKENSDLKKSCKHLLNTCWLPVNPLNTCWTLVNTGVNLLNTCWTPVNLLKTCWTLVNTGVNLLTICSTLVNLLKTY